MHAPKLKIDVFFRWAENREIQQFFEQEFEFYTKFAEAVSCLLIYLTIATFIILNTSSLKTSLPRLLLGLLLAFCSRFLNLAALLWVTGPDTAFLWTFVEFLFLLTSVTVTRVTTDLGPARSWIVMLVTHGARHVSSNISHVISSDTLQTYPCSQ